MEQAAKSYDMGRVAVSALLPDTSALPIRAGALEPAGSGGEQSTNQLAQGKD